MKTIWKYKIKITDKQAIDVPSGYLPLKVGEQSGELFIWFLVEEDNHTEKIWIRVLGTGNPIFEKPGIYLDSVIMSDGFVWHVFYTPTF